MTVKFLLCCTTVALGLSACQTPHSKLTQIPTSSTSSNTGTTVLEQRNDLQATPNTQSNQARLIRQDTQCVIEFTGQFESGSVTEYWTFQGNQLLQNHTLYAVAEGQQVKQQQLDPKDPEKYVNFLALKQYFSPQALAQCQNFAAIPSS